MAEPDRPPRLGPPFAGLKTPVRELPRSPQRYGATPEEEAIRRVVRSAMAEVVQDLRDGLEQRIRSAVTSEVAPILEHLAIERKDKEAYRNIRERRERLSEVRVRKAEVELEKLEAETIDKRISGKHKRTIAWMSALVMVLSALAGLIGATVNSRYQSPVPSSKEK